jgi:hypothetical protein
MASVVKHSYLKGAKMKARASTHINYILYRKDGEERDDRSARKMYSQDNDNYLGLHLKEEIGDLKRGDVVHKLIISPGHNDVDLKQYVREVMGELGRAKGLDLRYGFVIHENTDHKHAHVVLLGRDADDKLVRLDKQDHMRLRAFGDRYLEREHNLERVMDKDMEMYCRTHNLNIMHEKERGELFYERLYKDDKKDARTAADAHLEWEKFNTDWKLFIEDKEGIEKGPSMPRYDGLHQLGRMSDLVAFQDNDADRQFWKDMAENRPDMKELAESKLEQNSEDRTQLQKDLNDRTRALDPFWSLNNISKEMSEDSRHIQSLLNHGTGSDYNASGIDVARVDPDDKVEIAGTWYTKFDQTKDLYTAELSELDQAPEKYEKLRFWISGKEEHGEHIFGEGPRHEPERVENEPKAREETQTIELDKEPGEKERPELSKVHLDLEDLGQEEQHRNGEKDRFAGLDQFLRFDEKSDAGREEPLLDIACEDKGRLEDRTDSLDNDRGNDLASDLISNDPGQEAQLESQQFMTDMRVFEDHLSEDKDERDDFDQTGI